MAGRLDAFARLLGQQAEAPCDECAQRGNCGRMRRACWAYVVYAHSGRVLNPLTRLPDRGAATARFAKLGGELGAEIVATHELYLRAMSLHEGSTRDALFGESV